MKRLFFLLSIILHIFSLYGQDSTKHGTLYNMFVAAHPTDTMAGKEKLFLVPVFGHTPEGGYEYGGAVFKNFYAKNNIGYRTSYVTAKGSYTSRHAVNFIGYGEFWSHANSFFWDIDVRHQEFPFYFFGIGNNTQQKNKVLMEERLSHINIEGAQAVLPHYYIGLNMLLEKQRFGIKDTVYTAKQIITPNEKYGAYANIGLIQLYDTRDNIQYTTKGIYAYLKASFFPSIGHENDFSGTQWNFNFRAFHSPVAPLTLGYNVVYNQFNSKIAPFYMLPQMGNDQIMRGYYTGRFRDKKLFAQQLELRYHFIPRLAVTSFFGLGETTPAKWTYDEMRSSYGGGIRYFFDVKQKSTIRFDYAVTQRIGNEKRQTGIYIILGEAF